MLFGRWPQSTLPLVLALASIASAHEHHDEDVDPSVPLGTGIIVHASVQLITWLILFPAGAILGITRSRWHVPVQTGATALSIVGYSLGHHHGGRNYHWSVHMPMASFLAVYLFAQFSMGVFLKLHIYQQSQARKYLVNVHGIVGRTFPIVGYIQVVFGVITLMQFCYGGHLGQCLAHYIMGSSFIIYATILVVTMTHGQEWLRRKNMSQDYLDSWVLTVWGFINALTEHGFIEPAYDGWTHKDMQHVSLGVVWLCSGLVGIWLGRNGQRNVIPAMIMGITGFAMSGHAQPSMISTKTHTLFGCLLMGVAIARIIEIAFVLQDRNGMPDGRIASFQHVAPMLLTIAGVCFMAAHEEQLAWVDSINMDHITYSLLIASLGFLVYLHVSLLLALWATSGRNAPQVEQTRSDHANGSRFSWKFLFNGGLPVRDKSPRPDAPAQNGYAVVAPDTNAELDELELDDATDAYWGERPDRV